MIDWLTFLACWLPSGTIGVKLWNLKKQWELKLRRKGVEEMARLLYTERRSDKTQIFLFWPPAVVALTRHLDVNHSSHKLKHWSYLQHFALFFNHPSEKMILKQEEKMRKREGGVVVVAKMKIALSFRASDLLIFQIILSGAPATNGSLALRASDRCLLFFATLFIFFPNKNL